MRMMARGQADEQAIRSVRAGDASAFDELVERYFGMIYMIGYARLADRQAAEDLAQEVFLRAFLHLDQLDPPGRFSAWLSQIARNLACDWLKHEQRASRLVPMVEFNRAIGEVVDNHAQGAADRMEARKQQEAVCDAVMRLPTDECEMVLLHYGEGMSKKEIGGRLGIHPGTVGRRLEKALRRMKGALEPTLRDASSTLRAPRAAVARTIAVVGGLSVMSVAAKAAVGKVAGSTASFASAGSASMAGGGVGPFKAIATAIGSGGMVMTGTKIVSAVVAAGVMVGGAYYYFGSEEDGPTPAANRASVAAPAAVEEESEVIPMGPPDEPVEMAAAKPTEVMEEPALVEARPEPPPVKTVGTPAQDELDFSTPSATVTSFTRVTGRGDWDQAVACFLPGGIDYEDIQQLAAAVEGDRGYRFKQMLEAIDPASAPKIVLSEELPDGRMKVVWEVTLEAGFEIKGRIFEAGDTMEYDATLAKTDDGQWLIDNF